MLPAGVATLLAKARTPFWLRAYDTSTEEGRSKERYRRARITVVSGFLARGLNAACSLLSVPLTIGYLGKERYGMWVAINALLTWAILADFGVARGLQNHLSEAYGKDDHAAAGRYMSSALFALTGIAVLLAFLMVPMLAFVPWKSALRIEDPALEREALPAMLAVLAIFLLQFPLGVVSQAYAAYQRSYVANLFGMASAVLSLVVLVVVTQLELGLPYLILALGGVSLVFALVNLVYILRDMPWLRPRPALVQKEAVVALFKVSLPMLLFQLGALLINEVQILTLAHTRGLRDVTDYSVFLKVYSIPVFIVATIESPIAAAFRESYSRGDLQWLRSAFWRMQRYKFVISVVALGLFLVLGNVATRLLGNKQVEFSPAVWVAAGVLLSAGVWNGGYNNLFMAVERLWPLVWMVVLNGVVTVALTWYLAREFGVFGVVVATAAFSLLVTTWVMPVLSRGIFHRAD